MIPFSAIRGVVPVVKGIHGFHAFSRNRPWSFYFFFITRFYGGKVVERKVYNARDKNTNHMC